MAHPNASSTLSVGKFTDLRSRGTVTTQDATKSWSSSDLADGNINSNQEVNWTHYLSLVVHLTQHVGHIGQKAPPAIKD